MFHWIVVALGLSPTQLNSTVGQWGRAVTDNPRNAIKEFRILIGHWDSPLHRRCPNSPTGSEWKTSNVKAELDL